MIILQFKFIKLGQNGKSFAPNTLKGTIFIFLDIILLNNTKIYNFKSRAVIIQQELVKIRMGKIGLSVTQKRKPISTLVTWKSHNGFMSKI